MKPLRCLLLVLSIFGTSCSQDLTPRQKTAGPPGQKTASDDGGTQTTPTAGNDGTQTDPVATALRGRPILTTAVKSVAFDRTGKLLAVGSGDGLFHIWNVSERRIAATLQAHENWAFDVVFNPDGEKLATAGGDNLVKLWNLSNNSLVRTFEGHRDDVHGVAFSPNGETLVSGSDDTTVMVWDVQTGKSEQLTGHERQVTAVDVSPDGKIIASASRDGMVRLWDLKSGRSLDRLKGHTSDVLSVVFDPMGKQIASASYDKSVVVWNIDTRIVVRTMIGHQGWVFAVAFSPNGEFSASGGGDSKLRLWKVEDRSQVAKADLSSDVSDVAFSPDGKTLVAGTALGTVELYEVAQDQLKLVASLARPTKKQAKSASTDGTSCNPQLYAKLHISALNPDDPEWMNSVARLAQVGDGYTMQLLNKIDADRLTAAQSELRERTIHQINKRVEREDTIALAVVLQSRLERAAYCDLSCNPLEGTLVRWTMNSIRPYL